MRGGWTSHSFFATLRSMERQTLSLRELMDGALRTSGLTQNAAAERAGITGPRWRQIVNGREKKGGVEILINGPADTLARMALAIGVTPGDLRAAKRDDAADVLEVLRHVDGGDSATPEHLGAKTFDPRLAWHRALAEARRAEEALRQARSGADRADVSVRNAEAAWVQAQREIQRLAELLLDAATVSEQRPAGADLTAPPSEPHPEEPDVEARDVPVSSADSERPAEPDRAKGRRRSS